MTLTYVPGADHAVAIDNVAAGTSHPSSEQKGTWLEAMQDPAFVSDQNELLELAADADSESVVD